VVTTGLGQDGGNSQSAAGRTDRSGSVASRKPRQFTDRSDRKQPMDSAARMYTLLPAVIGVGVGGLFGLRVGIGFVPGALVGGVIVPLVVRVVLRVGERVTTGFLNPSGDSTAYRPQYSHAEALAMQGDVAGAIKAYEQVVSEHPSDPEPCVRLARIHRDQREDFGAAAVWFARARDGAGRQSGQRMLLTQELIELYVGKLREPRKAIPELALLASEFADTPAGRAAAEELRTLRELVAQEQETGVSLTAAFYKRKSQGGPSDQAGEVHDVVVGDL
jgi:hypothetical protein